MPLFFFISAALTPSSYTRKGVRSFHLDRAKRLSIPLLLISSTIIPFSFMIGMACAGIKISFVFSPGPGWFIAWLILLNMVFSTVKEAGTTAGTVAEVNGHDEQDHQSTRGEIMRSFPSTIHRISAGIVICGITMGAVLMLLGFPTSFALLPIATGSIICDLFLFGVGILACNNKWLEKTIRDQLDIPIWALWTGVIAEAMALWFLSEYVVSGSSIPLGFAFIIIAGMFCLDMCLAVLEIFQSFADYTSPTIKFLAEAAYTVYLIHPIVITALTAGFIEVYRAGGWGEGIQFTGDSLSSKTQLVGPDDGGAVLAIGWFAINIMTHAIVWP